MPTKKRLAKARLSELGDVTKRYFLDEISEREASELLKPQGPEFQYIEEQHSFMQMFWQYSQFPSEAAVWQRHHEELLAEFVDRRPGHRPRAWWKFDNTFGRPFDGESETEFLDRHGLLSPDEAARLTKDR